MELFTNSVSPNGRRVAIAMREKGIDIPATEIDLRKGENLDDAHLARNPVGGVPVLALDSGLCIAESVAITRYLEGLEPEPRLFGEGQEEQALIEMWNRRVELNLLLPVAQAFRNLTGFFKDRETVCKEWGEISAERAQKAAPIFAAGVEGKEFIAGQRLSVADITLWVTLTFAKAVGQDFLGDSNLAAYHERLGKRPSFST